MTLVAHFLKAQLETSMNTVNIFGGGYQRARKDHTCWTCGQPIPKGERFFRTACTVNGKMFTVKHCRIRCECTSEMLDQNPQLAAHVFSTTLKEGLQA
jgi:hypothetical protein